MGSKRSGARLAPTSAPGPRRRARERLVSKLPSYGLCDALVLAFIEALVDADTALCKNKGVAFFGWLYHSLGGASLKLVTPPRFGNPAMKSLLKEATTACQRFNKAAI